MGTERAKKAACSQVICASLGSQVLTLAWLMLCLGLLPPQGPLRSESQKGNLICLLNITPGRGQNFLQFSLRLIKVPGAARTKINRTKIARQQHTAVLACESADNDLIPSPNYLYPLCSSGVRVQNHNKASRI